MSIHNHFLSLWQGLKGLDNSSDSEPTHTQTEEAMEGINGGTDPPRRDIGGHQ